MVAFGFFPKKLANAIKFLQPFARGNRVRSWLETLRPKATLIDILAASSSPKTRKNFRHFLTKTKSTGDGLFSKKKLNSIHFPRWLQKKLFRRNNPKSLNSSGETFLRGKKRKPHRYMAGRRQAGRTLDSWRASLSVLAGNHRINNHWRKRNGNEMRHQDISRQPRRRTPPRRNHHRRPVSRRCSSGQTRNQQ